MVFELFSHCAPTSLHLYYLHKILNVITYRNICKEGLMHLELYYAPSICKYESCHRTARKKWKLDVAVKCQVQNTDCLFFFLSGTT
jgi:hypothetical protein